MLNQRIHSTLEKIGFGPIPQDPHAPLERAGLDSLMLALLIIELEREFQVKIPVIPLVKEHYESIGSIAQHLRSLGVE